MYLILILTFCFSDELPSSSPQVLPPTNGAGAGGSPPDTGGQISNPATDAPAPIPPPVPASAPVPTAPSPPSPTLPPHISQPPVSICLQIFILYFIISCRILLHKISESIGFIFVTIIKL